MKKYLKPALVLFAVCAATALILAAVNALTAKKIAENQSAAETEAVYAVFGDGVECAELSDIPDGVKRIVVVSRGGEVLGWCVSVSPNGFGGNIDMVVGISPDKKIVGISITALSETPGLGSRVAEAQYLAGYEGLGGDIKLGSGIDAISGATISSRSVLTGVNRALDAVSGRDARQDAAAAQRGGQ